MIEQRRHCARGSLAISESFDSLRRMGRRSILALLGIAVGCAAVVALLNIGHCAALDAIEAFKGLGTNLLLAGFTAQPGLVERPAPATLDITALSASLPGMEQLAPVVSYSGPVRHKGHSADAAILGTTAGLADVLELRLAEGRFLSDFDQSATYAVAGARVARELDLRPGSLLRMDNYVFEVIGIAARLPRNPLLPLSADEAVFVPITGMRRLVSLPEINFVIARARDTAALEEEARALKAALESVSKGRAVDVQIPRHLLDGLSRQSGTFAYLLAGLGGLSLLVGGIGVMNVMLMNVSERRREIGAYGAGGARARHPPSLSGRGADALPDRRAVRGARRTACRLRVRPVFRLALRAVRAFPAPGRVEFAGGGIVLRSPSRARRRPSSTRTGAAR